MNNINNSSYPIKISFQRVQIKCLTNWTNPYLPITKGTNSIYFLIVLTNNKRIDSNTSKQYHTIYSNTSQV